MSTEKLFVFAATTLVASLFVLTSAAPRPNLDGPSQLDLSDVINKTVCPIKVHVQEDKNRIPRRIRVMECGDDGTHWCSVNRVPENECCQHRHNDVQMRCVTVQDLVQVYYPADNSSQMIRVSVGCVCLMQKPTQAEESGFS